MGFQVTATVAQAMMATLGAALDAGTACVIVIYDATGGVPDDVDDAITTQVPLAELVCAATAFTSIGMSGNSARGTFAAINADPEANAGGVAAFFRAYTQAGGTPVCQGTVGTADATLVLNTTTVVEGLPVSILSGTIDLPKGT